MCGFTGLGLQFRDTGAFEAETFTPGENTDAKRGTDEFKCLVNSAQIKYDIARLKWQHSPAWPSSPATRILMHIGEAKCEEQSTSLLYTSVPFQWLQLHVSAPTPLRWHEVKTHKAVASVNKLWYFILAAAAAVSSCVKVLLSLFGFLLGSSKTREAKIDED